MADRAVLYLPTATKDRLVAAARAHGFEVGRGSKSQLAAFVDHLIDLADGQATTEQPQAATSQENNHG